MITAAERIASFPAAKSLERAAPAPVVVGNGRWSIGEWFIVSQTALPAVLLLPGTQAFRLPLRIAPYAISLALLVRWVHRGGLRGRLHPARVWLAAVVSLLVLMLVHPTTNTLLSAAAQIGLYLSVMAPALWMPECVRGCAHARRLLLVMLVCNGINACVGVMQVYDPERWMPAEISARVTNSDYGLDRVSYRGPDGYTVIRPPGLFDNPGAVAGPATYAGLLGVVFATAPGPIPIRIVAGFLAVAGVAAICLSFVRTSLIVLGGMFVVYVGLLLRRAEFGRLLIVVPFVVAVGLGGFSIGARLGGDAIVERFGTLRDEGADAYSNAGRTEQLQYGVGDLLFRFPLGAGLGRWGMMQEYFGDPLSENAPPIWAELQPNAWILDGGLLLVVFYVGALVITTRYNVRLIERPPHRGMRWLASIVMAANAGVIALIFGFTPFTNQIGMQYWLLTGVLHGAALREHTR